MADMEELAFETDNVTAAEDGVRSASLVLRTHVEVMKSVGLELIATTEVYMALTFSLLTQRSLVCLSK
jgi:hypothetical protein